MHNIEFDIRSADTEEGVVSGIAVPYGQTINVAGFQERFEPGAIEDVSETKLYWNHEDVIGKVLRGTDTEEGFLIEAKISKTPRGEEVLTLLRDGVIDKFSVGFQPIEDRDEEGVTVRTKVRLKETSLVPFPAYSEASVLAVREEQILDKEVTNMNETTNEVAEVRSEIEDLRREMETLNTNVIVEDTPSYRSYGDYVKAVVAGEEHALDIANRAYAGAVVSPEGPDSIGRDAWSNEALLLVDQGRPSLSAFRQSSLPQAGLNVDFPAVQANTIDAEVQAAQGDTLVFGKLSLETKSTPVLTIGGWTDMSRQAIERSSVAYVDAAFRAMAIAYGRETNAQFIAALTAGTYTDVAAGSQDAKGISEAIANASVNINGASGMTPQFLLVSSDVYVAIATQYATDGRPVLGGNAPVNNIGNRNLATLTGNVEGLTIIVDPALPAGTCFIANSEAMVTWESGGPTRLSDEDITNLTAQFSVYGYAAFGLVYPEAINTISGLVTP